MVRYRRNLLAGGTFFFTAALADRGSSTLTQQIVALRDAMARTKRDHPFRIDAVVILPEHLHLMMALPPHDTNFPARWYLIKRRFTQALAHTGIRMPRRRNGEIALWQRRYWEHTIRDEIDFERHVDYIHFNPVKHGLVNRVRDWPYSSFHRYVRLGLLPQDWGGDLEAQDRDFGERRE